MEIQCVTHGRNRVLLCKCVGVGIAVYNEWALSHRTGISTCTAHSVLPFDGKILLKLKNDRAVSRSEI